MDVSTALMQLELSPDATGEEAARAYKDLIRVWHPDNFAGKPELLERATVKTKLLNEAWAAVTSASPAAKFTPVKPVQKRPVPHWLISVLIFVGTLVFLGSLAGLVILSDLFNPSLRLEKELVERAFLANRHLPLSLDADTTLSAVFSGPGPRFTYVYQVMNYTKDEVGRAYFDGVSEGLKTNFRADLQKDRDLRFFYDNNIILEYSFKDKNGADILTLEIKPELYKTY